MPKIFLSYRREDSEYAANSIYERLVAHYGDDSVFMDVHTIPFGVDFRKHLSTEVGRCQVFLAVIGDHWLDARFTDGPRMGERRLDDPEDFVRIEIESALERDIPVIPVLVGRALVPAADALPEGLKEFSSRNATPVRAGADFGDHVQRLIKGMDNLFATMQETAPDRASPAAAGPPDGNGQPAGSAPADVLAAEYFYAQQEVIEELTSCYVGRSYVDRAFDRFVEANSKGYFLIQGGPGQGKSAVACHLIKSRGCVHHLVSRSGGRSDSRLILRSLLAQLLHRAQLRRDMPDGPTEMQKLFEELLAGHSKEQRPLLVMIDALDELSDPEPQLPSFLVTRSLPRNVFVVVTSRLGERLTALEQAVSVTPHESYPLGPLQLDEMGQFLRSRAPALTDAEIERIADVSGGNPLYLRAVADELERNPAFDLAALPADVAGFFAEATKGFQRGRGVILNQVLGLLSVARKSLSIAELSRITGVRLREVDEAGIQPIRQFLFQVDDGYQFYHARFHEFVTGELFYADELVEYHRMLAEWLEHPESRRHEYRLSSLAHHLYHSGEPQRLAAVVDERFLAEKVRQHGYAVLEDIELLTRSMLEAGDPSLVERCVSLVDALRSVVGGDLIDETGRSLRTFRAGPESFRSRVIEPALPSRGRLDVYVGMLPKGEVGADFFEVVPDHNRLIAAIGDAPGMGLKSAFVARFLGNVFRQMVVDAPRADLAAALGELQRMISGHEYFDYISMQCAEVDPQRGILTIANAGHPFPVLYSARRRKCDRLPVRGSLLQAGSDVDAEPPRYEQRRAEIARGDILLLITDGLTEGHQLVGEPYGYRFQRLVEERADQSARVIGEAILDDWRAYPREGDYADDVTVLVVAVR